ncbi:hypothetical protein V6N13_082881 [Hibiscus sabdariffa]|uniref:BZIP domain-containing protein n=1 Tax=Hibiscus sabdariffa TaxID=183260 RepID=A0ABR2BZR3_9ROSI
MKSWWIRTIISISGYLCWLVYQNLALILDLKLGRVLCKCYSKLCATIVTSSRATFMGKSDGLPEQGIDGDMSEIDQDGWLYETCTLALQLLQSLGPITNLPQPFSVFPNSVFHHVSISADKQKLKSLSCPLPTTSKRSMEEVWEDISLPPLNDHSPAATAFSIHNPTFPSTILQDFLATPINNNNKELSPTTSPDTTNGKSLAEKTTPFGCPPPPSAILLSLNSGSDNPSRQNPAVLKAVATQSFGSYPSFPCFCNEKGQDNSENSEDRQHKRKMKNRESAARSRARKQAYTHELELKVAQLLEENAKLRRQQDKILAAPNQLPKRNTLCRTLTAPF